MSTDANVLIVLGAWMLAILSMAARWDQAFPSLGRPLRVSPLDRHPHVLTPLGHNGAPNPMAAESFADYHSALARQRQMARHGQATVVTHRDSGEVRVDHATLLGPFGRITF